MCEVVINPDITVQSSEGLTAGTISVIAVSSLVVAAVLIKLTIMRRQRRAKTVKPPVDPAV